MTRVLVIEDDPFLRNAYKHILEKEGFAVEVAPEGKTGLKAANANEPDVIILDLLMPEMDGLEFLRRYDVKKKHPNVKVIIFSNMNLPEKVNEAAELGAVNYETKALFSPKEMVSLIQETLAHPSYPM
jgi:CheY-like chemotaxis protein